MKQTNIILDCGHGGIDSNVVYTTSPFKMYTFKDGVQALEGQLNREIGKKVGDNLLSKGYKVLYTVQPSDPTDLSLYGRIGFANEFSANNTLFVSLHSNASPKHNARGFEIWTSKGETKSDTLASYIGASIMSAFPSLRFRKDTTDGDIDKESNLYVLKNTKCVAVLLENLFFDNRQDYELLRSETFQNKLSQAISFGIIRYIKTF